MSDESIITPFCKFLEEDHSKNSSPLIGLIKRLQKLFHKTKADFSLNFSSFPHHFDDDYLDYFINELHCHYQIKDIDDSKFDNWLNENSVKIEDLEKHKFPNKLKGFFERHYDQASVTADINELILVRNNIISYFKNKYAQEIINFLESKKRSNQIEKGIAESVSSEEYVNVIIQKIDELRKIQNKIAEESNFHSPSDEDALLQIQMRYEFEQNLIEKNIKELLDKLYYQSAKDNYFYPDCPASVYTNNFDKRFDEYQKICLDADIVDFVKAEVSILKNQTMEKILNHNGVERDYSHFFENKENYLNSLTKKMEFLQSKLMENGFEFILIQKGNELVDIEIKKLTNTISEEISPVTLDLPKQKNAKQLTANQIILLLQETGFFVHPKIEKATKVRQAELISRITGLNDKNIKTRIEKLEQPLNKLGKNHKNDIDKIDDILNNLE